uniref:Uncharacterized protein n=1 Tax=Tanacetum cinerariifolium TaxID=118510 RepID=A0A699UHF5_TANCI|nr:hypothetical protein [Tanacetum cinerariifolium]
MFHRRIDIKDRSFSSNSKVELFLFNSNNCIGSVKKWSSKIRGILLSSFISRITKSAGKVNLPTSTSMFSAIPTRYWDDLFSNLTLIYVGLRVSRDNLAYSEYGIRLMPVPRSAKALQEKVLLKLHGIKKLPGSLSLGETLFWIIAELSSLKKAAKICSILCLLLISSLRNFP